MDRGGLGFLAGRDPSASLRWAGTALLSLAVSKMLPAERLGHRVQELTESSGLSALRSVLAGSCSSVALSLRAGNSSPPESCPDAWCVHALGPAMAESRSVGKLAALTRLWFMEGRSCQDRALLGAPVLSQAPRSRLSLRLVTPKDQQANPCLFIPVWDNE